MDIATFIATVTDRNLRREIFMNMDDATLNALPPQLLAEGRQIRDYIANDRARREQQLLQNDGGPAAGFLGRQVRRE